uniref:Ig-like domain-containing protein n=1 Tax=Equus caballus TaxID=9796 RepID=A0A9L0R644_HORSE
MLEREVSFVANYHHPLSPPPCSWLMYPPCRLCRWEPVMRMRGQKRPKVIKRKCFNSFETFQSKRLVQPNLLTFPSSEGSVTSAAVLPAPAPQPAAFPLLSHAPAAHPSAGDGFCPDINASGRTRAQSVTQPDVHITVSEGAPLELRCDYSSSLPLYLFWYMQYPNQGLQLLLKYSLETALLQASKVLRLNLRRVRPPST